MPDRPQINREKTHCPHGHEYTPENTKHQKTGRRCRTCDLARDRRRWASQRKSRAPLPAAVMERFCGKYIPEPNSGCWLWFGTFSPEGYGRFYMHGRIQESHRASYQLFVGEIPDGLEIDHLCRVPACVNPSHLEPVTHLENMRRAKMARRSLSTPQETTP